MSLQADKVIVHLEKVIFAGLKCNLSTAFSLLGI